jgi:hypothetical protein
MGPQRLAIVSSRHQHGSAPVSSCPIYLTVLETVKLLMD